MKKLFIISFFTLFLLAFFRYPFVFAATQDQPGINCGMAEAPNGINKCCSTTPQTPRGLPFQGALSHIPGLGSIVGQSIQANQQVVDMQKQNLTACLYGQPSNKSGGAGCTCKLSVSTGANDSIINLCEKYIADPNDLRACKNCGYGGGLWSGLGCVPLNLQNFITNFVLSFGVVLAFLVAFICIIYSAYILQTSQGNPERIKKAREYLTNCIIGLFLIIGSVFLLRLIGVTILGIPFLK